MSKLFDSEKDADVEGKLVFEDAEEETSINVCDVTLARVGLLEAVLVTALNTEVLETEEISTLLEPLISPDITGELTLVTNLFELVDSVKEETLRATETATMCSEGPI